MKSMKPIATTIIMLGLSASLALSLAGCGGGSNESAAAKTDGGVRCAHEIKQDKCPFCNPQLIESDGFCGEHAVAEALCYQCRPYLKAAFRAKGDWCTEHEAPESQCVACHPKLKEKMQPGSGHGVQG